MIWLIIGIVFLFLQNAFSTGSRITITIFVGFGWGVVDCSICILFPGNMCVPNEKLGGCYPIPKSDFRRKFTNVYNSKFAELIDCSNGSYQFLCFGGLYYLCACPSNPLQRSAFISQEVLGDDADLLFTKCVGDNANLTSFYCSGISSTDPSVLFVFLLSILICFTFLLFGCPNKLFTIC